MIAGLFQRQGWQLCSKLNHPIDRIIAVNFPLILGQLRRYDNAIDEKPTLRKVLMADDPIQSDRAASRIEQRNEQFWRGK